MWGGYFCHPALTQPCPLLSLQMWGPTPPPGMNRDVLGPTMPSPAVPKGPVPSYSKSALRQPSLKEQMNSSKPPRSQKDPEAPKAGLHKTPVTSHRGAGTSLRSLLVPQSQHLLPPSAQPVLLRTRPGRARSCLLWLYNSRPKDSPWEQGLAQGSVA